MGLWARRNVRRAIPEVYQGFGELHRAAFAPGALEVKTKELIALAIGVVEGCDGCIASHAHAAVRRPRVLHPEDVTLKGSSDRLRNPEIDILTFARAENTPY